MRQAEETRERSAYLRDRPNGARRRDPGRLFHSGEARHAGFPRRGATRADRRGEATRRLSLSIRLASIRSDRSQGMTGAR